MKNSQIKSSLLPEAFLRVLEPEKKYIVAAYIPKGTKDIQAAINRIELAFKAMGVKNIVAVPYGVNIYEVKDIKTCK